MELIYRLYKVLKVREVLQTTFLGKPKGSPIKDGGKIHWVSDSVQRTYKNDKAAILKAISGK